MAYYAPTYWQYVDHLTFTGGSASEGLILAPNPTIVDAAHRNGVPVLGNIDFPPNAFGGQISWLNDLLQTPDGVSFPIADKLILLAQTYGFDGWFINQETAGGDSTTAAKLIAFIQYAHSKSSKIRFEWYDAMNRDGSIYYHNELDSYNDFFFDLGGNGSSNQVSDYFLLNYNWTEDNLDNSVRDATRFLRSPYQLFAGMDMQANGYTGAYNWRTLFHPRSNQIVSLGLFMPNWTFTSSTGSTDLARTQSFYAQESKFWVGSAGDPTKTTGYVSGRGDTGWHGIANYIPAQSSITTLPFVTNFNVGQGNIYCINGQQLESGGWNNLSVQDVMPTWRWIITSNGSTLTPSIDFSNAYYGGTSLKVSGNLEEINNLSLYETRLPVTSNTNMSITFTTGQATAPSLLQLVLTFSDDTTASFSAGNTTTTGWNTVTFNVGVYSGKTIKTIGLQIGNGTAVSNYSLNVGRIALYNGTPIQPAPPTAPLIESLTSYGSNSHSMRLKWTHSASSPTGVYYYNLYQLHADGSRTFVGATPNNAYFIPNLSGPLPTNVAVEAVGPDFGVSTSMQTNVNVDYGARKVNSMAATPGTKMGGADDYDYLALRDHPGPSGVPVGGIGVGCFDYAPDGSFTRIAINNWHSEGGESNTVENPRGTFLAIWSDGKAKMLRRGDANYAGMPPASHTTYRGLFPIAECQVDDAAKVRVWSGLVPQDIKDSSLPCAWVEVEIANPSHTERLVSVALSWQDVIGRNLRDFANPELLSHAAGKSVWEHQSLEKEAKKQNQPTWSMLPRLATVSSPFDTTIFTGIRQHSVPFRSDLITYQNYNNEVAILAEKSGGARISLLLAFPVDSPDSAWAPFLKNGDFDEVSGDTPLFTLDTNKEMASAVAVKTSLLPGETRVIRFLVSWFQPEIDLKKAAPGSFFGNADYGRYFMNSFKDLPSLVTYAAKQHDWIYQQTCSWQKPILDSTYPDWLKFKIINSGYTLYTNAILNKAGDFTVMEGGMGGLAGTMDQRISAHPFYFKFFTALDRSDLEMFGHTQASDGGILHFDGHYYWGLASRDGTTPVPDNKMLDNTGGWLVQVAKDWQQSGDAVWLSQFKTTIPKAIDFLASNIKSKDFHIPTGSTTYDDFWHPDLYAYNATLYPAVLQAGAILERTLGDEPKAAECDRQAEVASRDAVRALWTGSYFAYGANLDGSMRRDDIMFSGQLAGQFVSRTFGFGDVLPMDIVRSSIVAQLKTNIAQSPDYYAPKVWVIKDKRAMNDPNRPNDTNADSTCWPFYLESYTAMTAIEAGYLDDGLDIMRHIQQVNLRNGWTWTQNLWRPGELTYVTAPVSWFITDVLAGSALDVTNHTIYLAPVLRPTEQRASLPIYFPRFWGTLEVERANKRLILRITRVFDGADITLNTVVARPVGVATSDQRSITIPTFKVQEGATLDLSANWAALVDPHLENPVLPDPDKIPFFQIPISKQ